MKALFIGRFQPFHLGHLEVVKNGLDQFDFIYIGIGSSQESNTNDNPFSYSERKEMISWVLEAEKISSFEIIPIPDIFDPPRWVDHVFSFIDDFSVVITNNGLTEGLFKEKGYRINTPGFFHKESYSGKKIRELIRNDEPWQDLVHPKIVSYLKGIKGEQRMKGE